jgi:ribosomal protein L9
MRASAGGGAKWWAPLLGWSGQPDYIDAQPAAAAAEEEARQHRQHQQHQEEARAGAAARRFGVLTEDKARQLRMRMMETESFHDAMYHSAIASRLASASPDVDKH